MVKRFLWRNRHGRPNVRVKGKVIPLRDEHGAWHEPDTPEGDRLYWEILNGKRAASKQSWNAAFAIVRASDWWAAKSVRYRADLEPVFLYLADKIGPRPVVALTQADIYGAMQANRHRVRFANYLPTALARTYREAAKVGWKVTNHAADIEPLSVPKERRKPHIPWTDIAVAKMRAEARPLPLLIFELGVGTTQRPDDLTRFTWGDFDGEALALTQAKTETELPHLPCTPELKAALMRARDDLTVAPHPARSILLKREGTGMDYRYMARVFHDERKRLDLLPFDLHALRYRGVMELAWAGCEDEEIASYSGHLSLAMIRKYAGKARQTMRAKSAAAKRR